MQALKVGDGGGGCGSARMRDGQAGIQDLPADRRRRGLRNGVAAGEAVKGPSGRRDYRWGSEVAFGVAWLRSGCCDRGRS